ncbi:MAG: T9SS type A sorting domain-containing protein [Candidatus Cloacimonetes bacterium]|nr:T9SS type A sorting domain-containing protein [Candidatus Cloacimonadota bacterium]
MKYPVFFIFLVLPSFLFCQPHPVAIEVAYENGAYPDTLIFQAWLNCDYVMIADNETENCFYPTGTTTQYLQIDCFMLVWDAGDTLSVAVFDPDQESGGTADYILTYENYQLFPIDDGGIILEDLIPLSLNFPTVFNILENETRTIAIPDYIDNFFCGIADASFDGNEEISIAFEYDYNYAVFSAPPGWFGFEIVTISLEDELGNNGSAQFIVNFNDVNNPPVADAGIDQIAGDLNLVTLDASGSYDPDGDEFEILWVPPAGVILNDPTIANPVFTAPETVNFLYLDFQLYVNDLHIYDTDNVIISVFSDEPTDLEIEMLPDNEALFQWQQPEVPPLEDYRALLGYNIYLDGVMLDYITQTEYIFHDLSELHTASVMAVYDEGNSELVSLDFYYSPVADTDIIPAVTTIQSIYPNPFNPETTISFSIAEESQIDITVYDIRGKKIRNLLHESRLPGYYKINWQADNIPSGSYIISMKTGAVARIRKVTLLK